MFYLYFFDWLEHVKGTTFDYSEPTLEIVWDAVFHRGILG